MYIAGARRIDGFSPAGQKFELDRRAELRENKSSVNAQEESALRLAGITWPRAEEYFRQNDTVLLAVGSIECHGKHMPLGTDTLIPEHLLEKIEEKCDVLIVPPSPTAPRPPWPVFPAPSIWGRTCCIRC